MPSLTAVKRLSNQNAIDYKHGVAREMIISRIIRQLAISISTVHRADKGTSRRSSLSWITIGSIPVFDAVSRRGGRPVLQRDFYGQ